MFFYWCRAMERVQPILAWAGDPANRPVIHTLVVITLMAPAALFAIYASWRWAGGGAARLLDAIAKQNRSLHSTIRRMDDQIAAVEAIIQAWRRLQQPVRRIDAAAADLGQRTAEASARVRMYLESGDTNAANKRFGDLSELHREAASLLAQSRSIATLLEKRLDYLHRSDAEMAALVRELRETRPLRRLLLPPRL